MRNEYNANRELAKNKSTSKKNPYNNKKLYDGDINDSSTWQLL